MTILTRIPAQAPLEEPLGRVLIDQGVISNDDLNHALNLQTRIDAQLGKILVAEGLVDDNSLQSALSLKHAAPRIDLDNDPPAADLSGFISPSLCLKHGVIPWMRRGDLVMIATAHPECFDALRADISRPDIQLLPVMAEPDAIWRHLTAQYGAAMTWLAERRVPERFSCRSWARGHARHLKITAALITALAISILLAPRLVLLALTTIALIALVVSVGLKLVAGLMHLTAHSASSTPLPQHDSKEMKLPRVSVLVPLLHEREIATALVARLSRLTYPKALLDVVLVLEEHDEMTRRTIAGTDLPHWMRVVEVPGSGGLTTKPRALNYALEFCHGSIIGVWDAEDEPAVDQIEEVVRHFHAADDKTVCLQGVLDYYNARENWLARCFTIEYATWWRLFLPGIARLGFVIPLGGTTLFFKRDKLIEVGGWDAYNVTEDADLGMRLARAGYRTELIPTVTMEEANCRPWRWVRQRSRWLKGFAMTWAVHMRHPRRLWRDLGPRKFIGFHLFFTAALWQFTLAPLLWTFWLVPLGVTHPLEPVLGFTGLAALAVLFITSELISITLNMMAVSGRAHQHLLPWTLSMILYFPLASAAMYKAFYEMLSKPFFWDKTQHGHSLK